MLACVFPGQGSQARGMGAELFDTVPVYKVLEDQIDAIAGFSVREMCLEAEPETLQRTDITQPCLFVVNALHWERMKSEGIRPGLFAGHSLGEYNALYAANTFDLLTGLYLVRERGRLMAEATGGGMAAVLGLELQAIEKVLKADKYAAVDIANQNTPSQIVISGPKDVVHAAEEDMKAVGASMFVPLQVGAAFHSRFMAQAAATFADIAADVHLRAPCTPVFSNVTAEPYPDDVRSSDIAALLSRQIESPVRWAACVTGMRRAGVTKFREAGPGQTLTRMIAQIPDDAEEVAAPVD